MMLVVAAVQDRQKLLLLSSVQIQIRKSTEASDEAATEAIVQCLCGDRSAAELNRNDRQKLLLSVL